MEKPLPPVAALLLLSLLAAGCAGFGPGNRTGQIPEGSPEKAPAKQPESRASGDGKAPLWEKMSPEARAYLTELAQAFARQDTAFLLAQGEDQFEAAVRPYYDEESYLAMLYRTGLYGENSPPANADKSRLKPGEIRGIEYTDWEEQGPMLKVRGHLITAAAKIPCLIVFNPRLRTPKILGAYP
ncbi:MAG: hypothetical protein LBG07_05735 [Treponema sp.]|jgi:hypothetical protein|nr:hypothetical protein [Treponema sp.]